MRRKFSRKTALGFFRRKSLAFFMAFLMVAPQISLGITPNVTPLNSSIREGAIKTGKVDMASGNLAFTEDIFSLKGYKLAIKYNTEGLYQDATAINADKPTGVVGLGWKLTKDRIVRLTHQTATIVDDEYLLNAHGKISKLVFEYEANDTIHFRLHTNPYWKIIYLPQSEHWIVQKETGKSYIYGDGESGKSLIDHTANSTEYSVSWDNWIGSSVEVSGQTPMVVAWNLSAIDDLYGQRVKLFYTQSKEKVGASSSSLLHTRASYLSKVIGMSGNYISLSYANKQSSEYEDPHTENTLSSEISDYSVVGPDGDDDRDAFQERYEKKYLSSVSRFSTSDVMDRKVEFSYGFVGSAKLKKRVLTSLQYLNSSGGKYQPSTKYDYFGRNASDGVSVSSTFSGNTFYNSSNGALYGAIKSITIPGGGSYLYQYDRHIIPKSNRSFDIPFPGNYTYVDIDGNEATVGWRAPMLFFMEDYVVVLHELNAYDKKLTNISICSWVGDHWRYKSFGHHEGHFYSRYHAEDYHVKNIVNTIKTALLTGISEQVPLLGGLMNAFNDDITDQMYTIYNVGEDLSEGDITGAIEDYMQGNFDLISDVALDIWTSLEEQFEDIEDIITTLFGIKSHNMTEQELADDQQDYNEKNPRKEYHITLQKDFFALVSTAGTSSVIEEDTTFNQALHVFEKDPLVDGNWSFSAFPVMLSSKYIDINSGTHFVNLFDECLDAMFNFTRFRYRTWNGQFIRINQALTDEEETNVSAIAAQTANGILEGFGALPQEDQDYLNLLSINKRSSVAARNNFVLVATSQANGSNARIQLFHHDQNKDWNWTSPAEAKFDKTLIPIEAGGAMQYLSQGLAANSLLDLKVGNSIGALQVYDNLDMEAYNDVMSGLFGGLGTTDGSVDPLNPLSSLQSDFIQDLSAMNATYGIVWDKNMDNLAVKLLHAGVGQTGMKMYVNGNVIQKVGKAYSAIIGAQEYDENGTNYAFRYDGKKFVSQTFQSDYFSSAMAPDVATQLNEADNKTHKIPEFQQYFANRPVTQSELSDTSYYGNVTLDGSSLSSYNAAEYISNVPGAGQWSLIDNASQEEINAPEFVKEAIHLASDILNLIIQIIMMIIPFAQEIAAAEKIISVIDKVTQVAGLAAMVLQPAADALVDKIMGVNHKSTSIANNYIATNGKLFARNPDGSWTGLGRAYEMNDDTDDIVGINNTLSNGHYNYTVKFGSSFNDPQNGGQATTLQNYVTLLKNRKIYRAIPFNQYVNGNLLLVRKDSLYLTDGNNAFVAYGPANSDGYVKKNPNIIHPTAETGEERRRKMSFEDATIIRLHRIADDDVNGSLSDYVVRSVETNTGTESTYMHYKYDNATATYSDAHGAAIYPRVDVIPSNQASLTSNEKPFGYTSYYYFNPLNFFGENQTNVFGYPAQLNMPTNDTLVSYQSFDHRDASDFNNYGINPLNGRQYLMEVRNSEDSIVHRRIDCHLLNTADFFHRNNNELLLDHVYQPLSSVVINETDGVLTRKVNTYDYTYNATVLRTVANYSTSVDGEEEVHYQSKTYAFEHYPDILDQNRIKEVSFVVDSVRKGSSTYILDATATSYKPWVFDTDTIWDVEHIYKANLTSDILDENILNYQAVAAAEVTTMDADFATYDALLAAYETELGNFSLAHDAVIAANQAANDSYDEVATTSSEIIAAQHELNKAIADLEESNAEMEIAKGDMDNAYADWQKKDKAFKEALAYERKCHDEWVKQMHEEKRAMDIASAFGPLAVKIAYEIEHPKVHDKWVKFDNARAATQTAAEAAGTAQDNYYSKRDIYNELSSQHSVLVETYEVAQTLVANAMDANEAAQQNSTDAMHAASAALNATNINHLDLTSRSHNATKVKQDSAIAKHNTFIKEAQKANTMMANLVSASYKYENQASSVISNLIYFSFISNQGYVPEDLIPLPVSKDVTGDLLPDMICLDTVSNKISLLPGKSSMTSSFNIGDALTGATVSNDDTIRAVQIADVNLGNKYSLLRFSSSNGLSLLDYDASSQSFIDYVGSYTGSSLWSTNWHAKSSMKAGDLDGNGSDDLLVFLDNGTKVIYDIKENIDFLPQLISTGFDLPSYTGSVWLADLNGDNCDDLIGIKNGTIHYHLSEIDQNGNHNFSNLISDTNVDFSSAGFTNLSEKHLKFEDVSGDGAADLLGIKDGNSGKLVVAFTSVENENVNFSSLFEYGNNLGNIPTSTSTLIDYNADGEMELTLIKPTTQIFFFFWVFVYRYFTTTTYKLNLQDEYSPILDEIANAQEKMDSVLIKHKAHIEDLKTQKSKQDKLIAKINTLHVKESDIESFNGQVYKWFKIHSIHSRDQETGYALTTADEKNVKSSDLYDKNSRLIIASVADADFETDEAIYCGFEDYEVLSSLNLEYTGQSNTVEDYYEIQSDAINENDAHAGKNSLYFSSNYSDLKIKPTSFQPNPELSYADSAYVVSAYVKADLSAQIWIGADTLQFANAKQQAKYKSDEGGWQYLEAVIIGTDLLNEKTPTIHITNSSGVYVDDVTIRPLAAQFEASVYNELDLPIAKLSNNGLTKHMYYDSHNRLSTIIDDSGRIFGLNLAAFSRDNRSDDAFSLTRPNEATKFSFIDKGELHKITNANKYSGSLSADEGTQVAFNLSVLPTDLTTMSLNFSFMGMPVSWQNQSLDLSSDASEVTAFSEVPQDFTFAAMGDVAYLWINGKLMKEMTFTPSDFSTGDIFTWNLVAASIKDDVIIKGKNPVFKVDYTNGLGQHLQSIRPIFNNSGSFYGTVVKGSLYDGWGNVAVRTLPMYSSSKSVEYQSGLITGIDWQNGEMSGAIADYYQGTSAVIDKLSNDYKYPYFRSYFEKSPLARMTKQNKPGEDFYLEEIEEVVTSYVTPDIDQAALTSLTSQKSSLQTEVESLQVQLTQLSSDYWNSQNAYNQMMAEYQQQQNVESLSDNLPLKQQLILQQQLQQQQQQGQNSVSLSGLQQQQQQVQSLSQQKSSVQQQIYAKKQQINQINAQLYQLQAPVLVSDTVLVDNTNADVNASKVEYQGADGQALLEQLNLSPDKYSTKKTTTSLGHKTIEVTDKMGRKVLTQKGSALSQMVDGFNDSGYAKKTVKAPNYFEGKSNSTPGANAFQAVHEQEDLLSLSDINTSADRGRVEVIKDQKGKVAFIKTASSTATDSLPGPLKYYRYDEQDRVIEQGISIARWDKDRLGTIAKAPFSYDIDMQWVKLYKYDIDDKGESLNNKGKITKTCHNDGVFITESRFTYNQYGQIIQNDLLIKDQDQKLISEKTIAYEYYPSGQVKKITYPNDFEVVYSFNRQGKIKGIGVPDDLDLFATYAYDELDRVSVLTRKNNAYTAYKKYDLRGRNKDLKWVNTNSDIIFRQQMEFFKDQQYYDTKIAKLNYSGTLYSDVEHTFTYDDQDRLQASKIVMNEGTNLESTVNSSYNYDANSNVKSYDTGQGMQAISYTNGTNQDMVAGSVAYNADGLKVRFNSPIWGNNSVISYNLFSNKAQQFSKFNFSNTNYIDPNVWYKLSAEGFGEGVITVDVKEGTKASVGDGVDYAALEANNNQLFRFVQSTSNTDEGYYHIVPCSNDSLRLFRTLDNKLVFDKAGSTGYYSDNFYCYVDYNYLNTYIISMGNIQQGVKGKYLAVVSEGGKNVLRLSSYANVSSDNKVFRLLAVQNAVAASDFILFSHDAKNNRVIKIRDIIDTDNVTRKDTLLYIHGNNRLPLSEYFSGTEESGGVKITVKTIYNYIYGPEFGSIGVRIQDLSSSGGE